MRGLVVGTRAKERNAIGTHSGSYALYRDFDPEYIPDLSDTSSAAVIGPYPQWFDAGRVVSFDPCGHMVSAAFASELAAGMDIRPGIAVTKAHVNLPKIRDTPGTGRLQVDGDILTAAGDARVTKAAIEPVWYLPGITPRFGITEANLRRCSVNIPVACSRNWRHAET